jgi:hypothetical protein
VKTLIIYLLIAAPAGGPSSPVAVFTRAQAQDCATAASRLNVYYTRTHIDYRCERSVR